MNHAFVFVAAALFLVLLFLFFGEYVWRVLFFFLTLTGNPLSDRSLRKMPEKKLNLFILHSEVLELIHNKFLSFSIYIVGASAMPNFDVKYGSSSAVVGFIFT